MATSSCKIDVKGDRLTFDVGECHAEFSLFEDQNFSYSSFACDEATISHKIEMYDDFCRNNPPMLIVFILRTLT